MGCDIHIFVEYREFGRTGRWRSLAEGEMRGDRDYEMFSALAGVRGDGPAPKGLPDDLSSQAFRATTLFVAEYGGRFDGATSPQRAAEWIKSGLSKVAQTDGSGNIVRVTHPDLHSHSWSSRDELDRAIAALRAQHAPVPMFYVVLSDILASLSRSGCESRIVYWFDN